MQTTALADPMGSANLPDRPELLFKISARRGLQARAVITGVRGGTGQINLKKVEA